MNTTVEFVEAVRAKHNATWYGMMKILGVTATTVKRYRKGIGYFDDDVALRVAELLNLEPGYVMACVAAERAKRTAVKKVWESAAKRLATAASVALAVGFSLAVVPGLNAIPAAQAANTGYTLYEVMALALALAWLAAAIRRLAIPWHQVTP